MLQSTKRRNILSGSSNQDRTKNFTVKTRQGKTWNFSIKIELGFGNERTLIAVAEREGYQALIVDQPKGKEECINQREKGGDG